MRKKLGIGVLVLLCLLLAVVTLRWSRQPGDALQITYLGATVTMDRFGITNQSHYAITQFGGPQIARHNEGNAQFAGPTRHLAKGEGFVLDVPVLVPSGKEWRLELNWEYDWRNGVREKLSVLRPVQNGSIVDRMQDYLLPFPEAARGEWIQKRFPEGD